MHSSIPLVLLPGMGADSRLFARQREAFPDLLTPDWIEPLPREPLPDYAGRMARAIDCSEQRIVGGASFGGAVALEMAACINARICILISSFRSPQDLPFRFRMMKPLTAMGPARLGKFAGGVAQLSAPSLTQNVKIRLRRLSRPEAAFLRWASWAVLRWKPSLETRNLQVFQIHGDADRTIPIGRMKPDVVVQGGGHLLPATHPNEVNRFLHEAIAKAISRNERGGSWDRPADA